MASGFSTCSLPDGARLAYEILGSIHLGVAEPLVLVGGMTSLRGDWERLSEALIETRPILIYDHRGMGDSTYSTPACDDEITIESMARDLHFLTSSLGWTDISFCGYSMGGVITQQLLLLPHHPSDPVALPYRATHVFLTATRSVVLRDPQHGIQVSPLPSTRPRNMDESMEVARKVLVATFDPQWLAANGPRFDALMQRTRFGGHRSPVTIGKQKRAAQTFNFENLMDKMPRETQFLVIHGELDQITPIEYGKDIINRIPWASFLEVGHEPGKVPSLAFGHHWYEYFDMVVWRDVIEVFLNK